MGRLTATVKTKEIYRRRVRRIDECEFSTTNTAVQHTHVIITDCSYRHVTLLRCSCVISEGVTVTVQVEVDRLPGGSTRRVTSQEEMQDGKAMQQGREGPRDREISIRLPNASDFNKVSTIIFMLQTHLINIM